jgi:hypothetical protein
MPGSTSHSCAESGPGLVSHGNIANAPGPGATTVKHLPMVSNCTGPPGRPTTVHTAHARACGVSHHEHTDWDTTAASYPIRHNRSPAAFCCGRGPTWANRPDPSTDHC